MLIVIIVKNIVIISIVVIIICNDIRKLSHRIVWACKAYKSISVSCQTPSKNLFIVGRRIEPNTNRHKKTKIHAEIYEKVLAMLACPVSAGGPVGTHEFPTKEQHESNEYKICRSPHWEPTKSKWLIHVDGVSLLSRYYLKKQQSVKCNQRQETGCKM